MSCSRATRRIGRFRKLFYHVPDASETVMYTTGGGSYTGKS